MRRLLCSLLIFSVYLFGCGSDSLENDTDGGMDTDIDTDSDSDTDADSDTDFEGEAVSDISLEEHPKVATILVLTWTQNLKVDSTWIEFMFENNEWISTPKKPGDTGTRSEVILGVPEDTEVTVRIVNEEKGSTWQSDTINGTTGALPSGLPEPTLVEFNQSLASSHKWMLGSVENTEEPKDYWESPYWAYIMDRKARIVWYYHNPLDSRILFSRISPDGTHIREFERLLVHLTPLAVVDGHLDLGVRRWQGIVRVVVDADHALKVDLLPRAIDGTVGVKQRRVGIVVKVGLDAKLPRRDSLVPHRRADRFRPTAGRGADAAQHHGVPPVQLR